MKSGLDAKPLFLQVDMLNINTSNVLLFKGLLGKTALMGQYNGHDSLHF